MVFLLASLPQVWMEDYRNIDSLEQIELFIQTIFSWLLEKIRTINSAVENLEGWEWIELKRIQLFILTTYCLRSLKLFIQ